MANIVSVILNLKDNISGGIKSITAGILNAAKSGGQLVGSLGGGLGSLASALSSNVLAANLMSAAITTGIGLATSAVNAFIGTIKEAADAQQALVMTVGAMQTVTRGTYEEAEELVVGLQGTLAQRAAVLPGETEDYIRFFRQVADDIGIVNREMNNGSFNAEQYAGQIDTVVSKFQVLGAQPGITRAQVVNTFQSIMGGQSLSFLGRLEFFRNNPLFANSLRAAVADMGKELEDMSKTERFNVLVRALDVSVTDETIERLNRTLTGMFAGLKTKIFDPNIGLLGFSRDLNQQLEGQQTVTQALTDLAYEVFGSPDSLFNTLGKLFANLGMSSDPMVNLYNSINRFTAWVADLNQIFIGLNNMLDSNTKETRLMRFLNIRLGGFIKEFSQNLGTNIRDGIIGIGNFIGAAFIGLVKGGSFLARNVDWGAIATGIIDGLIGVVKNTLTSPDLMTGIIGAGAIARFILLAPLLLNPISIAIGIIGFAIADMIIKNWEDIKLGTLYSLQEGKDLIGGIMTTLVVGAKNKLFDITMSIYKVFDRIADGIENIINGITRKLADVLGIVNTSANGLSSITSLASTFIPGGSGGGRYQGQIPNAAGGFIGGLLDAVMRESRNAPVGSRPVIANTSEAILNQAQQAALGQALSSARQVIRGDLTIGTINFPSMPSWTPEAVTDFVLSRISQEWEQFTASKLSSLDV